VMTQLLSVEEPAAGAALAIELSELWRSLDEPDHAQAALEQGLLLRADDEQVRDRLEQLYGERQQWDKLAALLEREAERLGPSQAAVARLRNAATMYRDQLNDLSGSASALRKALAITPGDLGLLSELARNLAASGRQEEAVADVTRLLDGTGPEAPERAELLRARAELLIQVGRLDEAVADLEAAYRLDPRTTRAALVDALERKKTDAFTSGDPAAERGAVIRLLALHDAAGDEQSARELLSNWVEQSPEDLEALRALRERDEAARRWDDVIASCQRLLALETGAERAQTAIALADACTAAGRPEAARPSLEQVRARDPGNPLLRRRLRELYEQSGARGELAAILLEEAFDAQDVDERVALFQRSARLYLEGGDPSSALGPLGEASKLRPDDVDSELLLIDIEIQLGRLADAQKRLDASITVHKKRRSPELALMYQRMGRLCAAQGDVEEQLKWLNQAMEVDRKSSEIASELADAAMGAQSYDTAMKALRAISMMDDPRPITRAIAFLRQAQIAYTRGDPRRAQHWARKAKSLDENSPEIDAFLAEVGG
jgi:tetratricopeptide (TPR) repeat protein